ncbi:hypothetical protein E2C01_086670 [Portunus trituberculatus]|uniref:Uncharacterized protein n=1 Tax=Portunus trituberculatus TaxID=210409 RepID=A0A5B7J1G9_PORTR|nr:hypothetical protein [Portunus trituberculatus]
MLRKARYHDNGEVDDLEGSRTHHHNNNNSGAFAWATRHSQLTCTVCACLLIPIALSYCISCSHAFTPTALHYAPSCPPWVSQHLTCPPSWRPQASTPLGNLQSFAFAALINNKNKLVFHIPT